MRVGDLVRYKLNRLSSSSPMRGKLYVVTFVFPSGASVRLGGFTDQNPHRIESLEVIKIETDKKCP